MRKYRAQLDADRAARLKVTIGAKPVKSPVIA